MRNLPIAVIALIALSGCVRTVWVKEGATPQDYNRESYECEKDARQSQYFGGGIVGAINFNEFENKCMVAHGWTATKQ